MFHYNIDLGQVILHDRLAPSLVMALVKRLPDTSMIHAIEAGGIEHFGWGIDRHLAADTFDAITENTRATGNWGKGKIPKPMKWPRPQLKKHSNKPKTVKELFSAMGAMLDPQNSRK